MIATQVGKVYEVQLPAQVTTILSRFAVTVSFGFNGLNSILECLDLRGYVASLAVYSAMPLLLAGLILLVTLCRMTWTTTCTMAKLVELAAPPMLKLAFLAYPLVTQHAFEAFSCFEFTNGAWLKADVLIECYTPDHDEAKALAWAAIIVYPIGLLMLNGGLLFAARRAIRCNDPTTLSCATAFLHRDYDKDFFWWELVEMLRRFVLVGLLVLAQGSIMQIIMGTLLAAAFLLFQVQASPYVVLADDFLASACSFALVAVFVLSYAFKSYELVGLPEIESKMSIEQSDYYIINQSRLAFVMVACILGTLLLSLALFAVQVVAEGRRLRREVRARMARRLRYLADDREVMVRRLPADYEFHLFLSHVWGTGEDSEIAHFHLHMPFLSVSLSLSKEQGWLE